MTVTMSSGATWPFVGRSAEMTGAVELLAPPPRAGTVVIDGEPGIGKTRLLGEVAGHARDSGWLVLACQATERERAVPFAPLLDVLPEVLPDPLAGVPVAEHRLYRAIRTHLTDLATRRPVLLVIDDIHWADDASLDLLEYLVSHPPVGPVMVTLVHRTGQCPPNMLRALGRSASVRWLPLGPLPEGALEHLLPGEPLRRRRFLHRASGGNPLYLAILTELCRHGPAAGVPDDLLPPWTPAATSLDRTITADLRTLDDRERLVAQALALLDGDADPALLARVTELDETAVAAALDALVARDVLRGLDGRHQFQFRHPLVQAAANRLAGPGWRAAAHERAADHLAGVQASQVRRARHLEHAARPGDEDAAGVLAEAARAVLPTDPAASVRWLRAALRILPDILAHQRLRAGWRVVLATALFVSGRLAECRAELCGLADLHGPHRTRALRLLATTARLNGRLSEATELIGSELRRTTDPAARVTLRFELLTGELLAGRWAAAARTGQALTDHPNHRHPGVTAATAVFAALGSIPSGSVPEVLGRLEHARGLVDRLDDSALRDALNLTVPLAWVELLLDQTGHALRHLERGIALADRYGRMHVLAQLYPARALALSMLGRIADALEDADEAAESARTIGSAEMLAFAQGIRLRPLWCRDGPLAAAEAAELDRRDTLGSMWHQLVVDVTAGEALIALGRSGALRERFLATVAQDTQGAQGGGQLGLLTPAPRALLGLMCLADGDIAGARQWLDDARATAVAVPLSGQRGAVLRSDAQVLLAEGRTAEAVDQARTAVDLFVHCGQPVRAANARVTLAEALLRTGAVRAAREELGQAKQALSAAGAVWLAEQTEQAQRRLGARLPRPCRPVGANGPLTPREYEVAELVAEGLTNRDIATRLYLSPRTVDTHIARILIKLEVTTRAAVARRLS